MNSLASISTVAGAAATGDASTESWLLLPLQAMDKNVAPSPHHILFNTFHTVARWQAQTKEQKAGDAGSCSRVYYPLRSLPSPSALSKTHQTAMWRASLCKTPPKHLCSGTVWNNGLNNFFLICLSELLSLQLLQHQCHKPGMDVDSVLDCIKQLAVAFPCSEYQTEVTSLLGALQGHQYLQQSGMCGSGLCQWFPTSSTSQTLATDFSDTPKSVCLSGEDSRDFIFSIYLSCSLLVLQRGWGTSVGTRTLHSPCCSAVNLPIVLLSVKSASSICSCRPDAPKADTGAFFPLP